MQHKKGSVTQGWQGLAMLAGDGLGGGCQHLEDGKKWKNHEKIPSAQFLKKKTTSKCQDPCAISQRIHSIDVLFRKWSGWLIHFPSGSN
jgi:hypothetical protein